MDGAYQHRLELLKIEIARSFEGRLQEMADKNNEDLEQIRAIYNTRLIQKATETNTFEETI